MSRDLTEAPVQGLIRKMALPASIGFFFNTMYTVVDTYFGGKISTTALAAMSLSFPSSSSSSYPLTLPTITSHLGRLVGRLNPAKFPSKTVLGTCGRTPR